MDGNKISPYFAKWILINSMGVNVNIKAFKFIPYFKTVLWGGDRIASYKGVEAVPSNVGESWEISGMESHESVVAEGEDKGMKLSDLIRKYKGKLVGESVYARFGDRFPLLVKIIDARCDLSLQVHPDDELARIRHNGIGKTEMWYIIDADKGALIYAGLTKPITREDYKRMVAENTIMDVVARHESHPGDLFYLPSGRLHTIGAGNFLVEIQQTSDITYRVYDFDRVDVDGKPRELHTQLAMDAIDYTVYDNYKLDYEHKVEGDAQLVKCDYFDVHKVNVVKSCEMKASQDSFKIVVCLEGEVKILDNFGNETEMHQGETVLVPAIASSLHITGYATLLTASM